MSIPRALDSSIFLTYLAITVSLMALGGIILALLKFVLGKDVGGMWLTYKGWLILAPLVYGAVFLGREATIVLFTIASVFAFKEFARATGLYRNWWMTGAGYVAIVSVGVLTLIPDPKLHTPGWYGMFMAWPAYAISVFLMIPILRGQPKGQLQSVSLTILGFIYIGWMFGHLAWLTNSRHAYGYLLFLLFAVELGDVAAFTFGKLFGKRKLCPEISPNKTCEGALGALVVGLTLPWLLWFSFPHFGPAQLVITGLIVGIGGQMGDLVMSFIKRDLGIKDMGVILPGHGGILDRVDSMMFVAPIFFHVTRFFHGL